MKAKYDQIMGLTMAILSITALSYAGSVAGTIKYEGEIPKFSEIKMDADPICQQRNTGPVYPQTLVTGAGNELANVFVYIKNAPAGTYPVPTEAAVLNQNGCMYDPHVLGVRTGQILKITNPDGTLHNVHSSSKVNEEFNIAMPQFRKETTKTFDKPEFVVSMKCDVHPWMSAYIAVMDHPFFSTSGNDGKFNIANLPAGTYTVEAWHEKLPAQTAEVTIGEGETKEINFTFSRP